MKKPRVYRIKRGENPTKPCEQCGKTIFYRNCSTTFFRKRFCSRECDKQFKFYSKGPDYFLWQRVDKNGPNGCWIYKGATDRRGYGRPATWQDGKPRRYYAHRRSYEIHNGPIPAGMLVLHKCDNPPCCNPEHLFLGTDADNHRDKALKGRTHDALLTNDQAREIKAALATPKRGLQRELADKYGVTLQTISGINRGKSYRHV